MGTPYDVGSLISVQGREWVVLPDSEDDVSLGLPVRGTQDETTGIRLALERDDISQARFRLPEPSAVGDYRCSRLLREVLRLGFRASAGPFRSFGRIAVTPRPYQLVPLLIALRLDPVWLLIADGVGVGKTIVALLVAREMLDHGDARRLAVLCSPQLAEQWQREMASKFHDAELVLPSTVTRLEHRLTSASRCSSASRSPSSPRITSRAPAAGTTSCASRSRSLSSTRRTPASRPEAPEAAAATNATSCCAASPRMRPATCCSRDSPRGQGGGLPPACLRRATRSWLTCPTTSPAPGTRRRAATSPGSSCSAARADIRSYFDEETTFPTRETAEVTYGLSGWHRG